MNKNIQCAKEEKPRRSMTLFLNTKIPSVQTADGIFGILKTFTETNMTAILRKSAKSRRNRRILWQYSYPGW